MYLRHCCLGCYVLIVRGWGCAGLVDVQKAHNDGNSIRTGLIMTIWFCEMKVTCHKSWGDLKETSEAGTRDCEECGKPVKFVDTQDDLDAAARSGECIAFYNDAEFTDRLKNRYETLREISNRKASAPSISREKTMTLGMPRGSTFFEIPEIKDDGKSK
jgi:hypothetical protein